MRGRASGPPQPRTHGGPGSPSLSLEPTRSFDPSHLGGPFPMQGGHRGLRVLGLRSLPPRPTAASCLLRPPPPRAGRSSSATCLEESPRRGGAPLPALPPASSRPRGHLQTLTQERFLPNRPRFLAQSPQRAQGVPRTPRRGLRPTGSGFLCLLFFMPSSHSF